MTQEQFRSRLLRLVEKAQSNELCSTCVLRDMIELTNALHGFLDPTAAQLEEHGISQYPPLGHIATHPPRETLQ